ncbi:polysaccharide pyruvyl transferase family protein [Desulfonatronum thioautotrophicum]|uniref:polysaccharide pyruvyl transferase family protein n=1 Tax=Desulfonatronum thioautotrophicum TaxID=617001 RepID=UPI00069BF733|nr:polysaccharide pyruvyl transferase family protein [Desulfonatronum thioautotrophicum]
MNHIEIMKIAPEIRKYKEIVHEVIGHLIPPRAPIALLDFPNHPNTGDSAIWLGEIAYLKKYHASKIIFVDDYGLINKTKPQFTKETIILIHGGGNLGDLYLRHQALREFVVGHYLNNRIIQLPQSVHFQEVKHFNQFSQVARKHPDFHLLVRDAQSLELAKKIHDGSSSLCTDMALCIGSVKRPRNPKYEILGLLRTDKEKVIKSPTGQHKDNLFHSFDWLDEPMTRTKRLSARIDRLLYNYPRKLAFLQNLKLPIYNRLARERFRRGCDVLSQGKVVITDRLHGHIMSTLLNIPHVVLDNSYGKISNFRDAWCSGEGLCRSAETLEEAFEIAQQYLAKR